MRPFVCGLLLATLTASASAPRVLIVGGGASHDFARWFNAADSATLATIGAQVRYTEDVASVLPALAETDVLYLSNNQPLPDPALREAIMRHVASGRGLIIGHAASWYNWRDWPAYNRDLVGGGTRAHAPYGEFTVEVVAPDHPIMQGVPSSFTLKDELYRFVPDSAGPGVTVLATAREAATGKVYPIVWTVQRANTRIVVNTLGHDGEAHSHAAYQRILQNSLRWSGRLVG
jgi:type 1 glutamine amidotransferase